MRSRCLALVMALVAINYSLPTTGDDGKWVNETLCGEVLSHDRKDFLKPVAKLMAKWAIDMRSDRLYGAALSHCLKNPRDGFDKSLRATYCNELENMSEGWRDFCRANVL